MHSSIISILTTTLSLLTLSSAAPLAATSEFTILKRTTDAMCASEGRVYLAPGVCPSGYVGCGAPAGPDNVICNSDRFGPYSKSCGIGAQAFNLGKYYECSSNGFVGCHTLDACSLDSNGQKKSDSNPTPPPTTPATPAPKKWACPPGTNYFGKGVCPSGFVGCHANGGQVCPGAQRFYQGDCPAGSGVFQVCGNGFVGCSTSPNMCG